MKRTTFVSVLVSPLLAFNLHAQTIRTWSGATGGGWLTVGNWSGSIWAGSAPNANPAGEGATTDIMTTAAANSAANIGINMNTLGAAGGVGLSFAGIDFNKTDTTTLQIGNSSTSVNGILQLNGGIINSVPNTLIRVAGSANLTIANVNTGTGTQTMGLRLGNTSGVIDVGASRTLTISSIISESASPSGFTKTGPGTLTLSGANTFTGSTTIRQGTVNWNANNALGTAGTIYLNDASTGNGDNTSLFRSANGGTFGRPIVVNNYGATTTIGRDIYVVNTTAVTGDLTLNKDVILKGGAAGANTQVQVDFQNVITGVGGVTISGYKVRFGTIAKTYSGSTLVSSGTIFDVGLANVLPHGATVSDLTVDGTFDLNTYSQTVNGLKGVGTVDTVAGGAPILAVGDGGATSTFNGVIKNTAGTLNLTKIGAGSLTLSGVNTYSGNTTVNQGTLALTGSGGIAYSPEIDVQSGAFFDVSGLSSTFTLGGSQTLKGNGTILGNVSANGNISPGASVGTLTFTGDLDLTSTTTMELDRGATGQKADLIAARNVYLGGTLTIQNIGASLQDGDSFDLFNGTIHNNGFSWASAFSLDGGLSWDLSQLNSSGIISVVAAPEPGSCALLLGGLALLLGRRLRRQIRFPDR
jgi:fibronectin-binding autotransporter adhesin